MKKPNHNRFPNLNRSLLATLVFLFAGTLSFALPDVPANIDHGPLDELLQRYVDEKGLVNYQAWKENEEDREALREYLAQFAQTPDTPAAGEEKIASLINAYNAFTIEFILEHYPVESIRLLDDPFDGRRHNIGGQMVSVDTIEHEMLRPIIGWKVHSVVVCAARSCPPLLNAAYEADTWEEQMEERYRTWLARKDLNQYDTGRFRSAVEISRIFRWYSEDYTGNNSVKDVLRRYGPEEYTDFLEKGDYRLTYMDYHWGLNDQSDLGKDYSHSFLRSLF